VKYVDVIERFVGDLLRARAANNATGRFFHSLGSTTFDDVPVKYEVFVRVTHPLTLSSGPIGRVGRSQDHQRPRLGRLRAPPLGRVVTLHGSV
jgi:hypothetical protein